jgi:hypothetical protein
LTCSASYGILAHALHVEYILKLWSLEQAGFLDFFFPCFPCPPAYRADCGTNPACWRRASAFKSEIPEWRSECFPRLQSSFQ